MDSFKLWVVECRKKLDEFAAEWERRNSPPDAEQFGATQVVVADNWGGLFDGDGDDSVAASADAPVVADNWGGLFIESSAFVHEPAPTPALDATSTDSGEPEYISASPDSVVIPFVPALDAAFGSEFSSTKGDAASFDESNSVPDFFHEPVPAHQIHEVAPVVEKRQVAPRDDARHPRRPHWLRRTWHAPPCPPRLRRPRASPRSPWLRWRIRGPHRRGRPPRLRVRGCRPLLRARARARRRPLRGASPDPRRRRPLRRLLWRPAWHFALCVRRPRRRRRRRSGRASAPSRISAGRSSGPTCSMASSSRCNACSPPSAHSMGSWTTATAASTTSTSPPAIIPHQDSCSAVVWSTPAILYKNALKVFGGMSSYHYRSSAAELQPAQLFVSLLHEVKFSMAQFWKQEDMHSVIYLKDVEASKVSRYSSESLHWCYALGVHHTNMSMSVHLGLTSVAEEVFISPWTHISICIAAHRLDLLPIPWPPDHCEMVVDSGAAVYSILAVTYCRCISEAEGGVNQSFLIDTTLPLLLQSTFFAGTFRPFRNSQLSVWIISMASMGQQGFVFVIMDCKCLIEAAASVTPSFWIHPILQLLVQSKRFSEFWLQSIIRCGYNLLFRLGTLVVLVIAVKPYAVILRETWTPTQKIFQHLWLVVETRKSCVTAVCSLSNYLSSAHASDNERYFCYHWHIREQKWMCWKDPMESPGSSPLKLWSPSTISKWTSVFVTVLGAMDSTFWGIQMFLQLAG